MLIIGCDFHTRYQQIAMAREETAELLVQRRLDHESGEAHAFYRELGGWRTLNVLRSFLGGLPFAAFLQRVGRLHRHDRHRRHHGFQLQFHRFQ